jgi:AmiR/NasT family two-component response regulator
MQRAVDEGVAYRRLQKLATDRRCKLVEAVRLVLTIEDVIRPPDASDSDSGNNG